MNIEEYFEEMKSIQSQIIEYIEKEDYEEELFENIIKKIQIKDFFKDRNNFKLVICLLSNIAKNHYRNKNFLNKIKKIFLKFKKEIKQAFSNSEIFEFFKNQKIILLFLIKEEIITLDKSIAKKIANCKYNDQFSIQYFYNEIKPFLDAETIKCISFDDLGDDYEEKRLIGENDEYICEVIRKDLIEEFIILIYKKNLPLETTIKMSIFETNSLLLKKPPTLIQYSAFFGSLQIFKYLYFNQKEKDPSLWIYAIHSANPEILGFLENNKLEPKDPTYKECLKESIKCHHNEVANYILKNFINEEDENNFNENVYSYGFHYHNYSFFPSNANNKLIFYYACQYDYYNIAEYYLSSKKVDVNEIINNKITPLYLAAERNNKDILNLLLSLEEIQIGIDCFNGCKKLTEIAIPTSIKKIESGAFNGCNSLERITIPSSLISIGASAFRQCSSLRKINFQSLLIIEEFAFYNCYSLSEINILSSVTSIGRYAFYGCSSLKQITLPCNITQIAEYAFNSCRSLKEITIPSSVVAICDNAFEHCSSLTKVKILSALTSIGNFAFNECSALNDINIPSSVSSIGIYAFSECTSLSHIKIPPSLVLISEGSFSKCSSLMQVSIPSSVTSIGDCAFSKCKSLTKIAIPSSVKSIGIFAFPLQVDISRIK